MKTEVSVRTSGSTNVTSQLLGMVCKQQGVSCRHAGQVRINICQIIAKTYEMELAAGFPKLMFKQKSQRLGWLFVR